MLFQIRYTKRSDHEQADELVDFVADQTEAVKKFMAWFFENWPGDAVRIDLVRQIEVIGDASILLDEGKRGSE